jgi:hypothetical protein
MNNITIVLSIIDCSRQNGTDEFADCSAPEAANIVNNWLLPYAPAFGMILTDEAAYAVRADEELRF